VGEQLQGTLLAFNQIQHVSAFNRTDMDERTRPAAIRLDETVSHPHNCAI
jgi:hypothetical protein